MQAISKTHLWSGRYSALRPPWSPMTWRWCACTDDNLTIHIPIYNYTDQDTPPPGDPKNYKRTPIDSGGSAVYMILPSSRVLKSISVVVLLLPLWPLVTHWLTGGPRPPPPLCSLCVTLLSLPIVASSTSGWMFSAQTCTYVWQDGHTGCTGSSKNVFLNS